MIEDDEYWMRIFYQSTNIGHNFFSKNQYPFAYTFLY